MRGVTDGGNGESGETHKQPRRRFRRVNTHREVGVKPDVVVGEGERDEGRNVLVLFWVGFFFGLGVMVGFGVGGWCGWVWRGSGDALPLFSVLRKELSSATVLVRKQSSAPIANYDRHPAAWVDIAARLPTKETRRCDTPAVEFAWCRPARC